MIVRLRSLSSSSGAGPLRLLSTMTVAPLAWIVQICACEALAAQACSSGTGPLEKSMPSSVLLSIAAISIGGLLIALFGFFIARKLARGLDAAGSAAKLFLMKAAVISNGLFVIGSLLTGFAALMVSPCRPW